MICLSKVDESLTRHLAWNQEPPELSPANTTRQDLNGIANLRAHVQGGQDDVNGDGNATVMSSGGREDVIANHCIPPAQHGRDGVGRQSRAAGLSPCLKTERGGGEDRTRCLPGRASETDDPGTWGRLVKFFFWQLAWVLSVMIASMALSFFDTTAPRSVRLATDTSLDMRAGTRHRRLLRKRDTCATGGVGDGYNTPLHVGALFIILAVSTLACVFPLLAVRFPGLRIPPRFFFAVRHFGTGVLIATAFVHLIPTAFISLGDPCLDSFWNEDYPAMPGAISLAAIFFVVMIEMVFHPSRHVTPVQLTSSSNPAVIATPKAADRPAERLVRDIGSLSERTVSISHGLTSLNSHEDGIGIEIVSQRNISGNQGSRPQQQKQAPEMAVSDNNKDDDATGDPEDIPTMHLTKEQRLRRELLQCVLLEFGILFHSVFIGMAISVSTGNEFIILLIAIAFHQTFEGLALGSRIAAVKWPHGKLQPWFMALAYGCTTPLGQAIGLALHTLYSPESAIGLIIVGVMNAISAGLLVFASLVELLSEDLLSDQSWRILRGRNRVFACVLIFLGAFFMSLVGAWA